MLASLSITAAGVFSEPFEDQVAMTFVDPASAHVNNTYSVVRNANGVIIGQIDSDVITVNCTFPPSSIGVGGEIPEYNLDICLYPDDTIPVNPEYSVNDLGTREGEGRFVAMGVEGVDLHGDGSVCFVGVRMSVSQADFVLVRRVADYAGVKEYTSAEVWLVYSSGALYGVGCVLIFAMWAIVPLSLSFSMICAQGFLLTAFRSVYFFVLASGVLQSGGLLDYILVEIPTFFYLGIFFQILLMSYFTIHTKESKAMVWGYIVAAILLAWLTFAAVIIAMSLVPIDGVTYRDCECRIVGSSTPSNDAQIIRIVYKSVILVVSLLVVISVVFFGRHLLLGQTRRLFFQIFLFSFCLFLNCLAFVIYYAIDQPSAYFLIALWVTELVPVVGLVFLLAYPELWVWKNTFTRSFSFSKSSST